MFCFSSSFLFSSHFSLVLRFWVLSEFSCPLLVLEYFLLVCHRFVHVVSQPLLMSWFKSFSVEQVRAQGPPLHCLTQILKSFGHLRSRSA